MPCADFSLPGIIDACSEATWDDLVLPRPIIKSLHEYSLWVEYRCKVEKEWGGKISGGPMALFAGPPGTGKTFAAEVLANTLGLPLFRVNLGSVISKYVGETEKNLDALFNALANEPMLLLLDDAGSLLVKRNEVKDFHHRYANLETSYLLSRIERYKGPSILISNQREEIDSVFARRFQAIIDFPFPHKAARSKLWRLHLPPGAPVDKDVDLDYLARKIKLSGGQIRNIALHAAFLAAGESSTISSKHITSAIRTELSKTAKA